MATILNTTSTKLPTAALSEHPNLAVFQKFDPSNIPASKDVIADEAVFHFFNPTLPDLQGDYVGPTGIQGFFESLGKLTKGTFQVTPQDIKAVGDELVVMQNVNSMTLEDKKIDVDVVVVWRIVDGRITEVWDIPSVFTLHTPPTTTSEPQE